MVRICCIAILQLIIFCLPVFAAEQTSTILTGKVSATVTRAIPLPFNSVVDEILVKPGDKVSVNTPLLRYHLQDEAGRILQKEVTNGAETEDLKGQVLDLERRLAETIAQRNKAQQLASSGLGSRQASGRLEEDVNSLKKRIELLNLTIAKTEKNFHERMKELESYYGVPLNSSEDLPNTLVLRAPIDGFVLSLDTTLNPGVLLNAGSTPIRIGQIDPVLIHVPVYEAEISSIKQGDVAEVEIPSLDNKKFTATVLEISWISTDMVVGNPSYYNVELNIPNPSLELKPGFKAVVRFKTESK